MKNETTQASETQTDFERRAKQREVLAKRRIFQEDMKTLDAAREKSGGALVFAQMTEAEFNRLAWEVALIATVNLGDEWDHIILAFDDPEFDWASAKLPKIITVEPSADSGDDKTGDLIKSIVGEHLCEHQISSILSEMLNDESYDPSHSIELATQLCEHSDTATDYLLSRAIEVCEQDCTCLQKLLELHRNSRSRGNN